MEEDGDMLDYVSTEFFDVTFGCHSYISVVTLTAWDNIVGTVFLKLWRNSRGRSGDDEVTPEAVKVVTDHALKTEMSREFSGVESKFYCLKNYNVIAVAFLFVVPHVTRSTSRSPRYNAEMFALTLILPLCEVSEWLSRHNLLVDKMKAILEFNLIPAIRQLAKQPKFKVKTVCLEIALQKFVNWGNSMDVDLESCITDLPLMQRLRTLTMKPRDLSSFIQLTNSIRHHCIPDPGSFMIKESFLSSLNSSEVTHFLERAISAFLYHGGYAVVVGRRLGTIQRMMKTLSYFMLPNERRMSRMTTTETLDLGFQKGLFVQGFAHETGSKFLPPSAIDLAGTVYRPAIIDVTKLEGKKVSEPIINAPQQYAISSMSASLEVRKGANMFQTDFTSSRRLPPMVECAPLIHTLLSILVVLPHRGGLRECYISQYMRLLYRKAMALAHYVNESWTPVIGSRLDPAVVMKELSITNCGDLKLLLGLASKTNPSISTKVLPVDYHIPLYEYISVVKTL